MRQGKERLASTHTNLQLLRRAAGQRDAFWIGPLDGGAVNDEKGQAGGEERGAGCGRARPEHADAVEEEEAEAHARHCASLDAMVFEADAADGMRHAGADAGRVVGEAWVSARARTEFEALCVDTRSNEHVFSQVGERDLGLGEGGEFVSEDVYAALEADAAGATDAGQEWRLDRQVRQEEPAARQNLSVVDQEMHELEAGTNNSMGGAVEAEEELDDDTDAEDYATYIKWPKSVEIRDSAGGHERCLNGDGSLSHAPRRPWTRMERLLVVRVREKDGVLLLIDQRNISSHDTPDTPVQICNVSSAADMAHCLASEACVVSECCVCVCVCVCVCARARLCACVNACA